MKTNEIESGKTLSINSQLKSNTITAPGGPRIGLPSFHLARQEEKSAWVHRGNSLKIKQQGKPRIFGVQLTLLCSQPLPGGSAPHGNAGAPADCRVPDLRNGTLPRQVLRDPQIKCFSFNQSNLLPIITKKFGKIRGTQKGFRNSS